MTKLHVHYSIDTYTQNKIYKIWSTAYINRGYIDPTEVGRLSVMLIDRQSADFVCDFSCV